MSLRAELPTLPATELAERIRNGEVTAREAVDAHLERIERRDDEINAYVTVCAEAAREAAAEADRVLEESETESASERQAGSEATREGSADVGPLHGVPIALKDLGARKAGVRHTYGTALLADNVADETAAVVERLEDAGAVVIGKTNTPALGHKGTTDNELVGPTASPIDTDCNAGGSSGGSAAALAAGMAPLATGSDAGGSIRAPAAACGVYGLKPTFGLVPDDGRPSAFGREPHHVTKGPMARSVADAAVMLEVMSGQHPADPCSVPVEIDAREAVERSVDDLRIAYSPDLELYPVEDDVRTVVEDALEALEAAGATVEEVSVDHGLTWDDLREALLATYLQSVRGKATVLEEAHGIDFQANRDDVADSLLTMLSLADHYDGADHARSGIVRTTFYDAVQDVLAEHDLLATPTLSSVGVALEADLATDAWEWLLTWPFNWTGHPAASAPAGVTDEGYPVGLQLVGRRFADDTVLAASAALERERPWDHHYE